MSTTPAGTLGRPGYSLGGDRPSQTPRLALSVCQFMVSHERQTIQKVVFHACLYHPHKGDFPGSHLCYVTSASSQGASQNEKLCFRRSSCSIVNDFSLVFLTLR